MEQAREEQYFRKMQEAQIKMLRDHIVSEIREREKLIKDLQNQINRNKKIIEDLKQSH